MQFKKEIEKALSDTEIRNYFGGKIKIVKYAELKNMKNIKDLLEPYGRACILYESKPSYGHWTCIMYIYPKNIKKIMVFDSYGLAPENELNYIIPYSMRHMSDQQKGYLMRLLYNQPLQVRYNTNRLQQLNNGINTCGRHCLVRMSDDKLDETQFNKVMRSTEYTPDELTVLLTKDRI